MDLFDLVAKLSLDDSDYDKGLDKAEKNANGLGNKLSKAFGVATKAGAGLAGGAVAAGAAIYGMATKSAETADHIDKMSQKLGLSREAYQELDFVASQSGTSVDGLRAGMKTLVAQMNQADGGSKKATEAFKALGISIYDSNGNLKDQETMLWESLSALNAMEEGTEKTTIATQLFGKAGTELAPMLNGPIGSIDEMRQKAHDLGLVLGDDTIDAGVKFTDTVDQMKRAFSAMGTTVGAEVMPIVQNALEFVIDHMPQIQEVVSAVFGRLESYVSWFVGIVETYVMPVLNNLIDFVSNVFSGDWSAAWESIKGLFVSAWDGIEGIFTEIFTKAKNAITGENGEGGIDWVGAGKKILDTITVAFSDLTEWATNFFENAKTALDDVDWESVGSAIWGAIKTGIGAIRDAFASLFGEGKEGAENDVDWKALGESILGFITAAFTGIKTLFTTIFNDAWKAIKEDVNWVKLGENILEFIKSAFSAIGSAFKTIFEKAWTAIKDDVDWTELGKNILGFITDVFEGVGGVATGVVDWFTGKFGEVVEAITGLSWEDMGDEILGFIEIPFGDTLNGAVSWFTRTFTSVLGGIKDIEWEDLGSKILEFIENPFEGTTFSGVVSWFSSKFTAVMEEIKGLSWWDVGTSIWNAIKDGIGSMGSIFQASDLFKLPEIRATTFQVGPFSIPDIEIVWNKKANLNPYMFSNATLFGAGEAGDEMLYGHASLMDDIRAAVSEGYGNNRLYALLEEYLPEILASTNKEIVLDDGTLVGRMDSMMGWSSAAAARGA